MDFENSCGIVYRFDHLIEFPSKFDSALKDLKVHTHEDWITGNGVEHQTMGSFAGFVHYFLDFIGTASLEKGFCNSNS